MSRPCGRLCWLAAGAAAAFGLLSVGVWRRMDAVVAVDVAGHTAAVGARSEESIAVARAVTEGGSTFVALPVIAVLGWLALPGRPWRARLGMAAAAFGVAAAGAAVGLAINGAINGTRPDEALWSGAAGGPTYPSGHTTVGTLLAAALVWTIWMRGRLTPAVGAGLAAVGVLVGLSRLWLGVHWPSDVLGGWLFGLAWSAGAVCLAGDPLVRAREPRVLGSQTLTRGEPHVRELRVRRAERGPRQPGQHHPG